MRNVWKKLMYKLQFWDGIWSVPFSFLAFALSGYFSVRYFGGELFDIGFLQPLALAALTVIFGNTIVMLGMFFNARSLQKFFYSRDVKVRVQNELTTWARLKLYLVYYFGLFLLFIILVILFMIV